MSTLEYIYLACAIGGAIIFLLRMVLMVVGGIDGSHGDMSAGADNADFGGLDAGGVHDIDLSGAHLGEMHADINGGAVESGMGSTGEPGSHDTDLSFRFLSIQGISSFIMMFGIVGLAIAKAPIHPVFSLAAGIGAGLFTVWVISMIFAAATGLQSDGTMHMKSAVGEIGTIYLRIPEGKAGKVQVVVQGALRVLEAFSDDGGTIPTGAKVKVVDVRDTGLVVKALHAEE